MWFAPHHSCTTVSSYLRPNYYYCYCRCTLVLAVSWRVNWRRRKRGWWTENEKWRASVTTGSAASMNCRRSLVRRSVREIRLSRRSLLWLTRFHCICFLLVGNAGDRRFPRKNSANAAWSFVKFRGLLHGDLLLNTLLVVQRRTPTVLFCVCKVSLQSFDIMPLKSLLSI